MAARQRHPQRSAAAAARPGAFLRVPAPRGRSGRCAGGSQASPWEEMPKGLSPRSADTWGQTWRVSRETPKGLDPWPRGGAIWPILGPEGCREAPRSRPCRGQSLEGLNPASLGETDPRGQRQTGQWDSPTPPSAVPKRANFPAEEGCGSRSGGVSPEPLLSSTCPRSTSTQPSPTQFPPLPRAPPFI